MPQYAFGQGSIVWQGDDVKKSFSSVVYGVRYDFTAVFNGDVWTVKCMVDGKCIARESSLSKIGLVRATDDLRKRVNIHAKANPIRNEATVYRYSKSVT